MLHEPSRHIDTFSAHIGLFRYKRLMFGFNAAPEINQNEIRKVIQGISGVANMSDDLVLHGQNNSMMKGCIKYSRDLGQQVLL